MTNSTNPLETHLLLAVVALALLETIPLVVLIRLAMKKRSFFLRLLATVVSLTLVIMSPMLLDQVLIWLNHTQGIMNVIVDPGIAIAVAPGLIALVLAVLFNARALVRRTIGA